MLGTGNRSGVDFADDPMPLGTWTMKELTGSWNASATREPAAFFYLFGFFHLSPGSTEASVRSTVHASRLRMNRERDAQCRMLDAGEHCLSSRAPSGADPSSPRSSGWQSPRVPRSPPTTI